MAAIDEDLLRCIQIDSAFVEGMKLGWNLAAAENVKHFDRIVRDREDAIIEARKELGNARAITAKVRTATSRT